MDMQFSSTAVYNMAVFVLSEQKTMQIEICPEKDNYYDLNWKVSVKDDEERQKSSYGRSAQLDEEGLVNSLNITNLSELQKVIES